MVRVRPQSEHGRVGRGRQDRQTGWPSLFVVQGRSWAQTEQDARGGAAQFRQRSGLPAAARRTIGMILPHSPQGRRG
jgi:hypothetical protein